MIDIDMFAGAGGWDEGRTRIDTDGTPCVGIDIDQDACWTAKAAGHPRVRADIAALDPRMFAPISGLIGSPPCTMFSAAGSGTGRRFLDQLCRATRRVLAGDDCRAEVVADVYPAALKARQAANRRRREPWPVEKVEAAARADAAVTALVLEPARYVHALNPEWVALEQVPGVLPIWREYERQLRALGWSAWSGILNSADFGVPQTRERAIIIASRVGRVSPPEPTHAQVETGEDLFGGPGRARWVSMASALGWNTGRIVNTRGDRKTPGGNEFPADRPSWALTGKTQSWFVAAGATGEGRPRDAQTQPAGTLTGRGTAYWMGDTSSANGTMRRADQPAATICAATDNGNWRWVHSYPSATVMADQRVGRPGHKDGTAGGESQFASGAVRVTVQQAAVLQSFPADYPWHGSTSKAYTQVGNAIPPRLAAYVLAAAMRVAAPVYADLVTA